MISGCYLQVRLPEDLSNAVKQAAAEHYLTTSGYVRHVLAEHLKRDGVELNAGSSERQRENVG